MDKSGQFYGPNAGYVLGLYEEYLADPQSVTSEARDFFAHWTPPSLNGHPPTVAAGAGADVEVVLAISSYVNALRRHGHRAADLSPINKPSTELPEELRLETYGLSESQLGQLPASMVQVWDPDHPASTALEAIEHLRSVYAGSVGYEFLHIQDPTERYWLREAAESQSYLQPLDDEQKRQVLQRLTEVEGFERFLHQTYLGQKRFSIEGTDMVVPMLDRLLDMARGIGIESVVIGMAHRGRLNVLAHVLEKPYEAIIGEFEHRPSANGAAVSDLAASEYSGDVKYHLGWRRTEGGELSITLAPNPSHLEWVNPVVEGMTRSRQDDRTQPGPPTQELKRAMPVLLHGDAGFPGQGVVAETLNLARLRGYDTGGTIHIITNNQIGYTTLPDDSRSTLYASDLAKGYEIPIVHVNADDPVACLAVMSMAMDYRERFHGDFLIDLIGYRRWGHNEGDEPSFTQPLMYDVIGKHKTARALWAVNLEAEGTIPGGTGDQMLNAKLDELQKVRDELRESEPGPAPNGRAPQQPPRHLETEVNGDDLRDLNDQIHSFPENFTFNRKLQRQLERRRGALEQEGGIDWAHAEALSFASILTDGTPIRMAGQDTERGTFGQRHLVLHDAETGGELSLLGALTQAKASFAVYNSSLSESGVLGFEYGYSVAAPEALVLWEAQFGDFANSAQVIIDQFIASSASKWGQRSGMVLLLPHGYEGQGPEHSSARLERFLQLAAQDNFRIVNLTTSAQYFHVLRRQAKLLDIDPRPLVVMTPKSLLRHPKAGSSLEDLAGAAFDPVIDDARMRDSRRDVRRVVLSSGKVYVDLITSDLLAHAEDVALVRVEELYPFPEQELREVLDGYPQLEELVWLQEEPANMGGWRYIEPHLEALVDGRVPVTYVGREAAASPAVGSADEHREEQERIVRDALQTGRVEAESLADD